MDTTHDSAKEAQAVAELLKSRQVKVTAPRQLILSSALQFSQPFHAEQLLEVTRKSDRAISLATIYRFLNILLQNKIVRQVDLKKDNFQYYEINRSSNFAVGYIICHDCKKVIEVTDPCLSLREKLVANDMGFTPTKLDLRIEADCQELSQKGYCSRQKEESQN
jgi:Fe2+ or Zn2+ uptake regulation protein